MKGTGNAITKEGIIKTIRNADISGCPEDSWLQVDSIPDVEDKYLKRDSSGKPVAMTAAEKTVKDAEIAQAEKDIKLKEQKAKGIQLLVDTDYTQLTDNSLKEDIKVEDLTDEAKENAVYRAEVRVILAEIKTGTIDPDSITWPIKPE